jgi:hypothetical protein
MASGGGKPQNLGIGLHLETKANGEQLVRDVKPGFDAEAKGLCEFPPRPKASREAVDGDRIDTAFLTT